MNRFVTSSIAVLGIAASAIAGPALARGSGMRAGENHPENDALYATTQTAEGSYAPLHLAPAASDAKAIDGQIRHLPAARFNVVRLDLIGTNRNAGVISDRMSEPGYLAGLHRAIESNRPLFARLESQNVEIRNVIGAEPAANGSMTFYVQ
jgi:hypothetical protein